MTNYSLVIQNGILCLESEGRWVLDTGSPFSLGRIDCVNLDGRRFPVPRNAFGLSVDQLVNLPGIEAAGLLGGDILNQLDLVFDVPRRTIGASSDPVDSNGQNIPVTFLHGIPVIPVAVDGTTHRMILDTGAELSYFSGQLLDGAEPEGRVRDYHPLSGWFEADVYQVDVRIGDAPFRLRAAIAPADQIMISGALAVTGSSGLVGNQIFLDRTVIYAPRRGMLAL